MPSPAAGPSSPTTAPTSASSGTAGCSAYPEPAATGTCWATLYVSTYVRVRDLPGQHQCWSSRAVWLRFVVRGSGEHEGCRCARRVSALGSFVGAMIDPCLRKYRAGTGAAWSWGRSGRSKPRSWAVLSRRLDCRCRRPTCRSWKRRAGRASPTRSTCQIVNRSRCRASTISVNSAATVMVSKETSPRLLTASTPTSTAWSSIRRWLRARGLMSPTATPPTRGGGRSRNGWTRVCRVGAWGR